MARTKLGYFSAVLGLAGSVGVLSTASAVIYNVSYTDVVNSTPDCTQRFNCTVAELNKVTCPTEQVPTAVTVTLLDADMDTNLVANNGTGSPICYNAININHQQLQASCRFNRCAAPVGAKMGGLYSVAHCPVAGIAAAYRGTCQSS